MSLISDALLKTSSISTHILVLTDKQNMAAIKKHVSQLPTYREVTRSEIGNLLHTIDYLRGSYETETKGKALPTMAAKHKDLIDKLLSLIFPNSADSLQQAGEVYSFLNYYLNQVRVVESESKEKANEAAS